MAEVAVVGAGLMGHALALVFALGGHQMRLTDSNAETLARAPGLMATALATLAEAGEADGTWNRQRLANAVRCVPSLADTVKGATLVVEAVVEQPDVKRTLYAQLDTLMEPEAILASNTSQSRYLSAGATGIDRHARSSRTGIRRPICATWSISVLARRRSRARSRPCAISSPRWARRRWCSSRWCKATSRTACRRRCNWRCTACSTKGW